MIFCVKCSSELDTRNSNLTQFLRDSGGERELWLVS